MEIVFSQSGFVVLTILLELLLILATYRSILRYTLELLSAIGAFNIIIVMFIISESGITEPFKVTWITTVLLLPLLGGLIYIYNRLDPYERHFKKTYTDVLNNSSGFIKKDEETLKRLKTEDNSLHKLHNYLARTGNDWIYNTDKVRYFRDGAEMFEVLKEKIANAEKFIFLEYFIIEEGQIWGAILEMLIEKVQQGVEVRVIYDGTCDFKHISANYYRKLQDVGIKCTKFAPIYPFLHSYYNFRDHRKIAIIDGKYGFLGGLNLADEYANINSPVGFWKDTAVMIEGSCVNSLTLMFLQIFNEGKDVRSFYKFYNSEEDDRSSSDSYIIPYNDIPTDYNLTGYTVYRDVIMNAEKTLYIMTPYYAVESSFENLLIETAMKGVEVYLILPGIYDKYITNSFAKEAYYRLIKNGIHVIEFRDGFIHAKQMCADGNTAVVGSINLDYRSFYHNFESALYMKNTSCIKDIEADMKNYVESNPEITLEQAAEDYRMKKIVAKLLKVFKPLF